MLTKLFWCLLGVNVAFLALYLAPRMRDNSAIAQRIDRPSDYIIIPGQVSGSDRGVVYILDSSNGMLSAMAYDDVGGSIEVMPPTDLARTFQEGPLNLNRRGKTH